MDAVLHVLSDKARHQRPLLEALVEAAQGGADVIQVREKKAPPADTYAFVQALQQALRAARTSAQIFVNDRSDIAIAADLDGIHLASKSLPIAMVERLRRQSHWAGKIGCSVHALDEAQQAAAAGADYVTFGHIFASASHPTMPPRGLPALRCIVEALSIPVIAIGGITPANVQAVLATGCSGVAVIGAILDVADPRRATERLKEAMGRATVRPKVPFGNIPHERAEDHP